MKIATNNYNNNNKGKQEAMAGRGGGDRGCPYINSIRWGSGYPQ